MRLHCASFAVLASLSTQATAEMATLDSVKSGEPEQSYEYVRCAAFYAANIEWAGQALTEQVFESSKKSIKDLMLIATLIRLSKTNGEAAVEHQSETVNLDTREIANLYIENYRRSYAIRGTAWEANPLWESDAQTCKPIAEAASQVAAELGDQP